MKHVKPIFTLSVWLFSFVQFLEDNSETSKECCKGMHYNQKHRLKEKANSEKNVKDTQAFVKKTLAILQMFIITQFGCGTGEFKRNMMKKTTKGNHWGWVIVNRTNYMYYCTCPIKRPCPYESHKTFFNWLRIKVHYPWTTICIIEEIQDTPEHGFCFLT